MVNSPMTMARVRNAPAQQRDAQVRQDDPPEIVIQPAPRLWAASVRVRMSIARRPVSTARYMYGSDRTT